MATDRSRMTARIVPLESAEAADARMGGTAEERIAAVAELTQTGWALAKLPVPTYTRATMPVRVTTLARQDDPAWTTAAPKPFRSSFRISPSRR